MSYLINSQCKEGEKMKSWLRTIYLWNIFSGEGKEQEKLKFQLGTFGTYFLPGNVRIIGK